jgi:superfamily II DNA or RNA helicase
MGAPYPDLQSARDRLLAKCSPPERHFYREVVEATLGESAVLYITPQHNVVEDSGKTRRIDFALVTIHSKFAIELDGFTYHAEGVVSPSKHSDDLARQNELVLNGWTPLRFSWQQVQTSPEACRDQLRRAVRADPLLHPSLSSPTVTPHAIQRDALKRLEAARERGCTRGLVVLPTGLGKTYLSAFDAARVGGRVLFIVHNNTILEQTRSAFLRVFPSATLGLFNSYEKKPDAEIVLANVATLRNERNRTTFAADAFSYVIIDEFHHGAADSYRAIAQYFRPQFFLGLTATPNRTDGRSILSLLHNNLIFSLTQREAIDRGFLVPFKYYGLRDNIDYSRVRHNGYKYDARDLDKLLIIERRDSAIVDRYQELAAGKKGIGFCVSINHAERAAAHFDSHGIPATFVHHELSAGERARRVAAFVAGQYQIVFVRDIFNEGVDFPDVEALLFMRPTESRIVFIQQLGRGLRLSARKSHVIVLDFIGNYKNAHRVCDYLSDAGASDIDLGTLRTKPVFYYDHGCEVLFDPEVVDVIASLAVGTPRDLELMGELSRLYQSYLRCPTFVEVCRAGKYSVGQYIAEYGTWEAAVARFAVLHEVVDVGPLGLPTVLQGMAVDEYVDAIELNAQAFYDGVRNAVSSARAAFDAFRQFSHSFPTVARSRSALERFVQACDDAASMSLEVYTVLHFRTASAPPTPAAPDDGCEYVSIGEAVAKRLSSVLRATDAFTMPRAFARQEAGVKRLELIVKQMGVVAEADLLQMLRVEFESLSRRLEDARHVARRALVAYDED